MNVGETFLSFMRRFLDTDLLDINAAERALAKIFLSRYKKLVVPAKFGRAVSSSINGVLYAA